MNSLKLITHNNEFVVVDGEMNTDKGVIVGKNYNITNTKEEIFQMWEEANRINLAEKYSYKSINEREERELEFIAFVTGYKSNPYNWSDEELGKACDMAASRRYSFEEIKQYLLMQRIKECFVEVEVEESVFSHVENSIGMFIGERKYKLYPNNSVRVTKIIV